jgi:hypothetical protein
MMPSLESSACSGSLANVLVGWRPQGSPIHGRQDKSADRGRAHVVGVIEVFGNLPRRRAGACSPKINDFSGPGAIARMNARAGRP